MSELFEREQVENFSAKRELIDVLSLWQPWASWVAWGWKTIESRTHDLFAGLAGRRLVIHATKRWDEKAFNLAQPFLTPEQIAQTHAQLDTLPRRALVCTVFVEQFRRLTPADSQAALIECQTPRFGLCFGDSVVRLPAPIVARGHQGIWQVSRELVADAL